MSHFDKRADEWDKGDVQVQGARKIAEAINAKIVLNTKMEVLDFGIGTGLLGFEIAKKVNKVFGVDTSPKMLEKVALKNTPECSITTYCQDIIEEPLTMQFDGLVSSMTLHHIKDLEAYFTTIYKNIREGGFIAIADLESEDGTFHSDNTGVFHYGFDEQKLCDVVKKCGFKDVVFENINTIEKPQRDFGVFLLSARR